MKNRGVKAKELAGYLGLTENYVFMVMANQRRFGADAAVKCVGFFGGKITLEDLLTKQPIYKKAS